MPAPRESPEASSVVLVLSGPVARADIPRLCERVRVLLEGRHAEVVICDAEGVDYPDAVTIDVLARLQLTALRLGSRVRLRHLTCDLIELLDLCGLRGVLPVAGYLLESSGEAEEREQASGGEKEADPGDLSI